MTQRTGWLYHVPRLRIPRSSHRHHHRELGEVILMGFAWIILAEFVGALWLLELEAWAIVWFYYGLFRGGRHIYRAARPTRNSRDPYAQPVDLGALRDPYAGLGTTPPQPVDLAQYGHWDGPTRSRS